ncbi:MAG TPA: hypothetical protein VM782_10910 [Stellaceae bacterium]|nr:hypothetical protein [Stellaceae bacterium]
MNEANVRPAVIQDVANIHDLLLKRAAEIPLTAETLEQKEALYAAIRKILALGQSWVAVDQSTVVGAVLVGSAETGRHWGENELLDIRYAAGDAIGALLGQVLERNVPTTAIVREPNHSGLADLLIGCGFRETETRIGERRFRYEP